MSFFKFSILSSRIKNVATVRGWLGNKTDQSSLPTQDTVTQDSLVNVQTEPTKRSASININSIFYTREQEEIAKRLFNVFFNYIEQGSTYSIQILADSLGAFEPNRLILLKFLSLYPEKMYCLFYSLLKKLKSESTCLTLPFQDFFDFDLLHLNVLKVKLFVHEMDHLDMNCMKKFEVHLNDLKDLNQQDSIPQDLLQSTTDVVLDQFKSFFTNLRTCFQLLFETKLVSKGQEMDVYELVQVSITCLRYWLNITKAQDLETLLNGWLKKGATKTYNLQMEVFRMKLYSCEENICDLGYNQNTGMQVIAFQLTNMCSWILEGEQLDIVLSRVFKDNQVELATYREYGDALSRDLQILCQESMMAPVECVTPLLFHNLCPLVKKTFLKLNSLCEAVEKFDILGNFFNPLKNSITNASRTFTQYIERCIKIDSFERVSSDCYHSSSVIDTIGVLDQSLGLIKDLEICLVYELEDRKTCSLIGVYLELMQEAFVYYSNQMKSIALELVYPLENTVIYKSSRLNSLPIHSKVLTRIANSSSKQDLNISKISVCLSNIYQFKTQLLEWLTDLASVHFYIDLFDMKAVRNTVEKISIDYTEASVGLARKLFKNESIQFEHIFVGANTTFVGTDLSLNSESVTKQRIEIVCSSLNSTFEILSLHFQKDVLFQLLRYLYLEFVASLEQKVKYSQSKHFFKKTKSIASIVLSELIALFHADGKGIDRLYLDINARELLFC